MSDDGDPSREQSDGGRPVARLTAAIAAAQAAARAEGDDIAAAELGAIDRHSVDEMERPTSEKVETAAEVDLDADGEATTAPFGASAPIAEKARRPGRRLWPLYAVMAVLVLAVPTLIVIGYQFVRGSTTGEVLSGTVGPSDPGYTALVEPTPVALILQVGDTGEAETATMLSLSGVDQHGGVAIAVPVNTRLSKEPLGFKTFDSLIGAVSPQTAGTTIGRELGLGFTEVIEVTNDELTRFVQPVSPLTIDNPDDVITPDGVTIAEGRLELSAEQIPQYLAAVDASPTVDAHMKRQGLVWSAWVKALADTGGDPASIPGESDAGLGRYLLGLAAGRLHTTALPTVPADEIDGRRTVKTDPRPERLQIADAVPFAVGAAPGERTMVSLLNGVAATPAPPSVIQRLTYAGAQISTAGNAAEFGVKTTSVTYAAPENEVAARRMARLLGVERVRRAAVADRPDAVTIVLGADLIDDPPERLTVDTVRK